MALSISRISTPVPGKGDQTLPLFIAEFNEIGLSLYLGLPIAMTFSMVTL